VTGNVSLAIFLTSGFFRYNLSELSQMDEFTFQNYHNRHSLFTMDDGSVVSGVAFLFAFPDQEKMQYYFVKSFDLIEFSAAQTIEDWTRCKVLATPFSLEHVKEAALLDA
jgi:hypothetical protein